MSCKENYGVVTEQGFVGGQFGFKPLNEQDKKAVEENDKKKKSNKKNNKDD